MNSSSSVAISKPGPNRTRPRLSSSVAGESNRFPGGGTGGNDWPGTPTPPDRDTLARGKAPASTAPGVGVTPGSEGGSPDPSIAPAAGTVPGCVGAEPAAGTVPGCVGAEPAPPC